MGPWTVVVRLTSAAAWILVVDAEGNDVLQASLPRPGHRRALRMVLESLALWADRRLSVAISADELDAWCFEADVFGVDWDQPASHLVELSWVLPSRERDRLGLPDFDALRRLIPGA
jgi:hypothetical protein